MKKLDKYPKEWDTKTEMSVIGSKNNINIYELKRSNIHNIRIQTYNIIEKKININICF